MGVEFSHLGNRHLEARIVPRNKPTRRFFGSNVLLLSRIANRFVGKLVSFLDGRLRQIGMGLLYAAMEAVQITSLVEEKSEEERVSVAHVKSP